MNVCLLNSSNGRTHDCLISSFLTLVFGRDEATQSNERNSKSNRFLVAQWCHFYHLYPRSFCSSGRGSFGDIQGIICHLDYLRDLGVSAIWSSPFFPSPDIDFGYDISDYLGVDPRFGTMEDVDDLIFAVHERGMRLVLDGVFNHCSSAHVWFKRACQGEQRDYFIWRGVDQLNNWTSAFGGCAWTKREARLISIVFIPINPI